MNIITPIIIAFSFFTIIPMPFIEWTPKRMRYVPLFLPIVGLVIGIVGYELYYVLEWARLSGFFKAVLLTLFYLVITGGIHMDGLMDTADAYFSRRSIDRKLEIMKDSRVGAFAVMAVIAVLLLKTAAFNEAISNQYFNPLILVFIPVVSRILQPSMLYLFPYARDEGIARMYGDKPDKRFVLVFALLLISAAFGIYVFTGPKYLLVLCISLLYYIFYYFSSKKQFGGITGDILGAFLEMSELLMLLLAAVLI